MRKAPWSARLLSTVLVGIGMAFPVQVMVLYGHDFTEIGAVLSKLTVLNYASMILCFMSAALIWDVQRFSMTSLAMAALVIGWNNYLVGYVGYDFSMLATALGTGSFLLTYSLLLHPDTRRALQRPDSRWWLEAERRLVSLPTEIHSVKGDFGVLKTFDISESGAFIGCDPHSLEMFEVGDYCNLSIRVSDYRRVKCMAKIVRITEGLGRYPSGIGLHFEDFDGDDQKYLCSLLKERPCTHLH